MPTKNSSELSADLRAIAIAMLAKAGARLDQADRGAIERFLGSFAAPPLGAGYRHVPSAAREIYSSVVQRNGSPAAGRDFLFAAILAAIGASLAAPAFERLPARVMAHQLRHYERMLLQPEPTRAACDLNNDLFLKDFGLASLRMVAAGSNLVDLNSGVGRSVLWKNGLRDLPRRLFLFFLLGGFRPCLEIHAHKFYMAEFNEEGRNECYRCCAELYASYPAALGMIAGSWFYDPAVAVISPHLAYLREVPEKGGAFSLFTGFDESACRNALATSATRRRLHEAGNYRPAAWTLVWPRTRHLDWLRRHPAIAEVAT